jgi:hypothetical protein
MRSVVDIGSKLYTAVYNLLSNMVVNNIDVPVIAAYGGVVDNLPAWVSISQVAQRPRSNKLNTGYEASLLVECWIKGDDYINLTDITNEVLNRIYNADEIAIDDLTAYMIGEPTIDEMIDDEDNSVMMRKLIRINMLIE